MICTKTGRFLMDREDDAAKPKTCGFNCEEGSCIVRDGSLPHDITMLRAWTLCGGKKRTVWPRSGSLEDQAAGTVYIFEWLDRVMPRG